MVHAQYELEGPYLATMMDGMFISLPTALDIKLPTMSMDNFDKTLEKIDENYPFTLSPKLILALLIVTSICFIAFGILFIWYKRKTSFTSSTVGNLSKLIPSLTEKKPTLNSLLPILSELKFPTNNQNTNMDTTTAVSPKPQITSDELSLPALVPHLQIKTIKTKNTYTTNVYQYKN